ncbi:hypothetical protein D3C73_1404890 [compost metagenome]
MASELLPYEVSDIVDAPLAPAQARASIVSGVSPEYETANATSPLESEEAEVICICESAKAVQFTPMRISFW